MPLFIGTILGLDYQPLAREDLLYVQNEEPSQSLLGHDDYLTPSGILPWLALRWDTFDIAGSIHVRNRYRVRLLGETTQEVELGALQLGLDFRPQLDQRGPIRSYLGIGLSGHIPFVSSQHTDEIQQEELDLLVEQYHTEIFSLHARISFGVDYNVSDRFALGMRVDQRFFWDPIYGDDFGVEYIWGIQSAGSLTLSWRL